MVWTMSTSEPVVLYDVSERIATVTLNRPAQRNALSGEVLRLLPRLLARAEADDDVDVVILTGADPAFCAGVDLKELGTSGDNVSDGGSRRTGGAPGPFPPRTKPLIGAINGVAVTGGFELALNCDFLVASERAKFGDTHARVGVMPGWGLTVLLPRAIGVRRAVEMSLTGNFMDADEALAFSLVNHVVAHADLIPFVRSLAADISANDSEGVRRMLATYAELESDPAAWDAEAAVSKEWFASRYSPEAVAARRASIMERGRTQ